MHNLLDKSNVKNFVLAGNATITIQSGKTGKYYTYKITKHKDFDLFFVKYLYGPDNTKDYRYCGCYYSDTKIFNPRNDYKQIYIHCWPKHLQAIRYFFERIDNLPDNMYIYHEGRCGRCGRKLTTPESIKLGLGPECSNKGARK